MKQPPLWSLIFIIICLLVPIFSVEGIIAWCIGIFFAIKCFKISQNETLKLKLKLMYCSLLSTTAVLLGIIFNLTVGKLTTFFINHIL